jgi:hypothetical protein
MVPCLSLQLKGVDAVDLRRRLEDVKIGTDAMIFSKRPDKKACFELRDGYLHLFVQFDNYEGPLTVSYRGEEKSFHEAGLSMMAHEDGVNCTAQHIPQGSLLIYSPGRPDASRTSISTADFVPSVLANFEMPKARELSGVASIHF